MVSFHPLENKVKLEKASLITIIVAAIIQRADIIFEDGSNNVDLYIRPSLYALISANENLKKRTLSSWRARSEL